MNRIASKLPGEKLLQAFELQNVLPSTKFGPR
jgi:hypothetical protein